MTTSKKSIRKIVFGTLVAGSAVLGSAFTTLNTSIAPGHVYGNSDNNKYELMTSPFDINNCEDVETTACAYRELPAGEGKVTAPFTAEQAEIWENQGLIEKVGNKSGLYIE